MSVATEQESKKQHLPRTGEPKEINRIDSESAAPTNSGSERANKRLFWSLFSLILFVLLTVLVWIWWDQVQVLLDFITDQESFGGYLQSFGIWGPIVLFAAQMLQVFFAFIPGHVVLIAAAYVYGFPLGLFFNITFTVVASQLAYLFARWAGRPVVYRLVDRDTVDYWERVSNQRGVLFFTISFLLPVFPSDAMNFVAGLSGISARRFLIANFIGRAPSAIVLSLIGAYGLNFDNLAWGMVIVAYFVFFVVGYYLVNKIKNSVDQEDEVTASAE